MRSEENQRGNRQKDVSKGRSRRNEYGQFSFGARRYTTKVAKRLFVPQKSFMSPTFALDGERTDAILRVISTSA